MAPPLLTLTDIIRRTGRLPQGPFPGRPGVQSRPFERATPALTPAPSAPLQERPAIQGAGGPVVPVPTGSGSQDGFLSRLPREAIRALGLALVSQGQGGSAIASRLLQQEAAADERAREQEESAMLLENRRQLAGRLRLAAEFASRGEGDKAQDTLASARNFVTTQEDVSQLVQAARKVGEVLRGKVVKGERGEFVRITPSGIEQLREPEPKEPAVRNFLTLAGINNDVARELADMGLNPRDIGRLLVLGDPRQKEEATVLFAAASKAAEDRDFADRLALARQQGLSTAQLEEEFRERQFVDPNKEIFVFRDKVIETGSFAESRVLNLRRGKIDELREANKLIPVTKNQAEFLTQVDLVDPVLDAIDEIAQELPTSGGLPVLLNRIIFPIERALGIPGLAQQVGAVQAFNLFLGRLLQGSARLSDLDLEVAAQLNLSDADSRESALLRLKLMRKLKPALVKTMLGIDLRDKPSFTKEEAAKAIRQLRGVESKQGVKDVGGGFRLE